MMDEQMIGYSDANYHVRLFDTSTILHALGELWKRSPDDSVAQDAADLYYRLKGSFATEMYRRENLS